MIEFKINMNEKIVVTEKSNCYGEQWWLVQYCSGSTLFTLDTETKRKRAIKTAKKYREIFRNGGKTAPKIGNKMLKNIKKM